MIATALAVGEVIGPLGAGFLAEELGYNGFFCVVTRIAIVVVVVFLILMPETNVGKGGAVNAKKLTWEGHVP
jgi:predicted MFS family arabinose efflux permease